MNSMNSVQCSEPISHEFSSLIRPFRDHFLFFWVPEGGLMPSSSRNWLTALDWSLEKLAHCFWLNSLNSFVWLNALNSFIWLNSFNEFSQMNSFNKFSQKQWANFSRIHLMNSVKSSEPISREFSPKQWANSSMSSASPSAVARGGFGRGGREGKNLRFSWF